MPLPVYPVGNFVTEVPPEPTQPATPAQIVNCPDLTSIIGNKHAPNDPFYTDISHAAVDPLSSAILQNCTTISQGWPTVQKNGPVRVVPELGSTFQGTNHPIGIPYNIIHGKTAPLSPVTWIRNKAWGNYTLTNAIDPGPLGDNQYPMPVDYSLIQLGPDHHMVLFDVDNWVLWEGWKVYFYQGTWYAAMICKFDLKLPIPQRRDGRTSADAAGLPICQALLRYDEIQAALTAKASYLNHALRFTLPPSLCHAAQISPGTHHAGGLQDPNCPVFGDRFRLKPSFDVSDYDPQVQIIMNTLKMFGMFMADIGGCGHVSGTPDTRWNDKVFGQLNAIKLFEDMEIVHRASAISTAMG